MKKEIRTFFVSSLLYGIMILLKVSHKKGVELIKNSTWIELNEILNHLTIKYENKGLMLVEEKITPFRSRTCEFATIKGGWECILIIVEDFANIKKRTQ
jgi:hypothetical protein